MPKKTSKKKSSKPSVPANYEEIAAKGLTAANKEHFRRIREKSEKLSLLSQDIGRSMVTAANLTRELGLELQMVLDKKQIKTENLSFFLRQHEAELPAWLDQAATRKFLSAAEQFPEPVKDLASARNVLEQMTFYAVGLLEEPHRETMQTAVRTAPLEKLVNMWTKYDESIARFREQKPEETWDYKTVETLVEATRESAALHDRLLKRLEEMKTSSTE
ncbi:MAG: hypothetical protein KGJ13_11245 [Patescibacteria group bacterium]|nr:hypothetical protein [Patescibacteria group bacterium]